jgi:D-methionine transport system ATP-binding protein
MIRLDQINKYYIHNGEQFQALKNVNLQVNSGEIFGIIGKSGAGKSTLLRCVNLLERPSSGTVQVAGEELTSLREPELRKVRHQIGMIFQHFNLLESATVYDNIALPLRLAGRSLDTITPLLKLTGLEDKTTAYPSQLSGGQKQRVAIARALVNQPRVLLCDEATSALDQETTHSILDLLRSINETLGVTILLITHEMNVIKTICERGAVIDQGEIVEQASLVDFLMRPQSTMGQLFSRAALQQEIPFVIQKRFVADLSNSASSQYHPVLRVFFQGSVAETPIIASLIQQFGVKFNILQASMEYIHHQPLGIMLLEMMSSREHLSAVIDHLTQINVFSEVIGYVHPAA